VVRGSIAEVRDQGAGVREQETVEGGKMRQGDERKRKERKSAAANFLHKRVDAVCSQVRDLKAKRETRDAKGAEY
jgi:hypothetical protein